MKMKNMIATMTAVAFSAISCVAMNASAAVTEIPYAGPSAGAMATENNGTDLRLNIFNEWGNNVLDIDRNTTFENNVTVTFTVSGIGTNSANTNEDGSAGAPYIAWLSGAIGTNECWDSASPSYAPVSITGDGQYSITWNLAEGSDSVSCLIISSNINLYNYGTSVDDCGVVFTLNSITTGAADAPTEPETTEAPATTAAPTTTAAAGTTTAAAGTTAAGATTAAAAATTAAANGGTTTSNAATGDTGVAVAVAALAVAGGVALVSKKRK
ncbi:MAG: NPXTG-anchored protein [Oscillospiraceae bacterium]|nr:NPXTG-anchored protein [Oscillospiraceae bacterium]